MSKVVFIDLDGTIINDENNIPDETISFIKEISHKISIILITGKPFRLAKKYHDVLGLKTPLFSSTGSVISVKYNGQYMSQSNIDYELPIDEAIEYISSKKTIRNAYIENIDNSTVVKYKEENDDFVSFLEIDALVSESKSKPINMFIKIDVLPDEELESIAKGFDNEDFMLTYWSKMNTPFSIFNLKPKKVTKLSAVKEYLKKRPFDETYAFGDGKNDCDLLQFVTAGYAMANASDSVKKCAMHVTEKDNNNNGVIHEMKKWPTNWE